MNKIFADKIRQLKPKELIMLGVELLLVVLMGVGLLLSTRNLGTSLENRGKADNSAVPTVEMTFTPVDSEGYTPNPANAQEVYANNNNSDMIGVLTLKPNGAPIIALEAYVVFHPDSGQLGGVSVNERPFGKVHQYEVKQGGINNVRFFLGIDKGQTPVTADTEFGRIAFRLKPEQAQTSIGFTQVRYLTATGESAIVQQELWKTGGALGKKTLTIKTKPECGHRCQENYTACSPSDPEMNEYMCWNGYCQLIACRGQNCLCELPEEWTPKACWVTSDNCATGNNANCRVNPSYGGQEGCQAALTGATATPPPP